MSLLVGSVGKEHNCNPAGENEVSCLVVTFVFLFSCIIRDSRLLSPELHRGKKVWMLIAGSPDEMWMLRQIKEEIVSFFYKKIQFSESSDKTSSMTGSSAAMFLVDTICTQTSAHWHPKILIKWYGSIYFVSLVEKKCSSICPEKTTENSIQMVNAHYVTFPWFYITSGVTPY